MTNDAARVRAWWFHRQGMDGTPDRGCAREILFRSGWARSIAGINPYLTLFSRGGVSRQQADDAAARLEIHELPAARGCTYVVPSDDFGLALKVGQRFGTEADMKLARKLGASDKDVDRLCSAVVDALSNGPLDPEGLRRQTGGAVRDLGEEGKKKGLASTLPLALGMLQSAGEIRRIPANGRLDQQRYSYALWRPSPLAKFGMSTEAAFVELARKYFNWIGPATMEQFQWFSGLGVKAAKAAVGPLALKAAKGIEHYLILPEHCDAFEGFKAPRNPQFVLVSSLDGIFHLRRNVEDLIASEDRESRVYIDREPMPIGSVKDLHNHAILDRGRLVGLWDYDVETESVAWMSFVGKNKALEEAVRKTEAFVRDELGDARSFSLDSPKSRIPRLETLRGARTGNDRAKN